MKHNFFIERRLVFNGFSNEAPKYIIPQNLTKNTQKALNDLRRELIKFPNTNIKNLKKRTQIISKMKKLQANVNARGVEDSKYSRDRKHTEAQIGKKTSTLQKPNTTPYNEKIEKMKTLISQNRNSLKGRDIKEKIKKANEIWIDAVNGGSGKGPFNENSTREAIAAKFKGSKAAMILIQNLLFDKKSVKLTSHGSFYMPEKNRKGEYEISPEHAKGEVLNNIPAGSTVLLSGVYENSLICNNKINIIGDNAIISGNPSNPSANLYLKGAGSSISGVIFSCENPQGMGLSIRADNCNVNSCTFTNIKGNAAIQSTGNNVRIENSEISNYSRDGIIFLGNNTTIRNVKITDPKSSGAHCDAIQWAKGDTPNNPFENRFEGNGKISGISITGCTIDGGGNSNIQGLTGFNCMSSGVISNNIITGVNSEHVMTFSSQDMKVTGNKISNCKGYINIIPVVAQKVENGKSKFSIKENTKPNNGVILKNNGDAKIRISGGNVRSDVNPENFNITQSWLCELPEKSYNGSQKDIDIKEAAKSLNII